MRTAILLFPGFEELDGVAPYEVLSAASKLGAHISIDLLSGNGGALTAFHGMRIEGTKALNNELIYDLLIVPGGAWLSQEPTGVHLAIAEGILVPWLRKCHQSGTILASVCTGSFLLAEAGLLTGRPATTHHSAHHLLKDYGAIPVHERVVDDGDIITAGGVTSGLDLSLWLIERFFGEDLAGKTEDYLEYKRQDSVYRNSARI